MSDTALNKIIQYGTAAARGSFTPSPASGSKIIYIWYETDTGNTYLYDTAWHLIASSGGEASALVLITETVTAASQATVSFTPIAATYRDLFVAIRGRGDTAATSVVVRVRFNNDSGANYDYAKFDANGGTSGGGSGGQAVAQTSADIGYLSAATAVASVASLLELTVGNYKGTTFKKNGSSRGNLAAASSINNEYITNGSIWWHSTAAITRLDILLSAGNFVDGSVVSLYGRH